MTSKPTPSKQAEKPESRQPGEEPGTNATEHEPDPSAQPIDDGRHKFIPKSPFTHGNS